MEMEEKNLAKPQGNENVSQLLGLLLGAGAIVVGTRCSLCNSKFAQQINEMCEARKTPTEIKKFLEENGEKPPSLPNICHHVDEHFKKQRNLAVLSDLCDKVSNLQQFRHRHAENLLTMLDIAYVDLTEKYSLPISSSLSEKDKNDMIMKVRKDIRETIQQLNEMDDVNAQVKAVEVKFIKVFKTKIDNAKTDVEKQLYLTALTDFKDLLDAMK